MTDINIVLNRAVEEIIDRSHLEAALKSGKKLRVKFGIDPTAPDLHLGHAVVLRKLRQFQELGHKIVLIIGDFTARIGDPSGRSEERKPLSKNEVEKNMKKYLEQAGKIIDVKRSEIHYNSEWFEKEGARSILELSRAGTMQQVLRRADFQKRLEAGQDITLLETLYPLMQGYDSVRVRADVEIGGTDQKFNLLMGRRVQRHFGMPEQDIMTVWLIEGTDGIRKMSKSYGNFIALSEKPGEMFGKIMSVPDALMEKYYTALTDLDMPKSMSPRDAKLKLAEEITASLHGAAKAEKAQAEFIRVFSKKEMPREIPVIKISSKKINAVDLILEAGLSLSKSEARRLILQGGAKLNHKVLKDPMEILIIKEGDVLRAGKKRFMRLTLPK